MQGPTLKREEKFHKEKLTFEKEEEVICRCQRWRFFTATTTFFSSSFFTPPSLSFSLSVEIKASSNCCQMWRSRPSYVASGSSFLNIFSFFSSPDRLSLTAAHWKCLLGFPLFFFRIGKLQWIELIKCVRVRFVSEWRRGVFPRSSLKSQFLHRHWCSLVNGHPCVL